MPPKPVLTENVSGGWTVTTTGGSYLLYDGVNSSSDTGYAVMPLTEDDTSSSGGCSVEPSFNDIFRHLGKISGLARLVPLVLLPVSPLNLAAHFASGVSMTMGGKRSPVTRAVRISPDDASYRWSDIMRDMELLREFASERFSSSIEVSTAAAYRLAAKFNAISEGIDPNGYIILRALTDNFGFRRLYLLNDVLEKIFRITGMRFVAVVDDNSGSIIDIARSKDDQGKDSAELPDEIRLHPDVVRASKELYKAVPPEWWDSGIRRMLMDDVVRYSLKGGNIHLKRKRAATRLRYHAQLVLELASAIRVFGRQIPERSGFAVQVIEAVNAAIRDRRAAADEARAAVWVEMIDRLRPEWDAESMEKALKGYFNLSEETFRDMFSNIPDELRYALMRYAVSRIGIWKWPAHMKRNLDSIRPAVMAGLLELFTIAGPSLGVKVDGRVVERYAQNGMAGIALMADKYDKPTRMRLIAWRTAAMFTDISELGVDALKRFIKNAYALKDDDLEGINDANREAVSVWIRRDMDEHALDHRISGKKFRRWLKARSNVN